MRMKNQRKSEVKKDESMVVSANEGNYGATRNDDIFPSIPSMNEYQRSIAFEVQAKAVSSYLAIPSEDLNSSNENQPLLSTENFEADQDLETAIANSIHESSPINEPTGRNSNGMYSVLPGILKDHISSREYDLNYRMNKANARMNRSGIHASLSASNRSIWVTGNHNTSFRSVFHENMHAFLIFSLPLLLLSLILFYIFDDPHLQFIPGEASISWWLLFIVRLNITWNFSRATHYLAYNLVLLDDARRKTQTRKTTRKISNTGQTSTVTNNVAQSDKNVTVPNATTLLTPWVHLAIHQSLGWPFLLTCWAVWTLLLLRGNDPFTQHWFFFLPIQYFSNETNSDHGILASKTYLNLLLSLVFLGVTTLVKRMYVALYLGRRMCVHFIPQVRSLMESMKLIAEVAEFASEDVSNIPISFDPKDTDTYKHAAMLSMNESDQFRESTTFDQVLREDDTDDESDVSDYEQSAKPYTRSPRPSSIRKDATSTFRRSVRWNMLHQYDDAASSRNGENNPDSHEDTTSLSSRVVGLSIKRQRSSVLNDMKNQLDRWKEPDNILSQIEITPTFNDIFRFRKALSIMDDIYPFTVSYGLADNRDSCIKSGIAVYKKLLRFTPNRETVPIETIGILAYEVKDDGNLFLNPDKLRSLISLFHPDENDQLPMIAFLQSCDLVYRKLQFLRASMVNSVRIDLALENIFDPIFFFLLLLIILNLLEYDVRTLLYSLSTVILSATFAIGSSISKYVEGIFFIAVRRPYDIGDRISMEGAMELAKDTGSTDTWLVEDIDLMTTTLRLSRTNEVSTVDNNAIANCRITNHARSPHAHVNLSLKFLCTTTTQQLDSFLSKVRMYVKDRPRIWHSVVLFRHEKIDMNDGWVEYLLRVQHVKSWQELISIMTDKGVLLKFCVDEAAKMNMIYIGPTPSMNVSLKKV